MTTGLWTEAPLRKRSLVHDGNQCPSCPIQAPPNTCNIDSKTLQLSGAPLSLDRCVSEPRDLRGLQANEPYQWNHAGYDVCHFIRQIDQTRKSRFDRGKPDVSEGPPDPLERSSIGLLCAPFQHSGPCGLLEHLVHQGDFSEERKGQNSCTHSLSPGGLSLRLAGHMKRSPCSRKSTKSSDPLTECPPRYRQPELVWGEVRHREGHSKHESADSNETDTDVGDVGLGVSHA